MGKGINPGDIFVESWGYDQTNVDAYQVREVTPSGKSVRIQLIATEIIDGRVRPVRDDFIELASIRLKRITQGWQGVPRLTMSSYSGANLWNGTDTFHDTTAAGQPGH